MMKKSLVPLLIVLLAFVCAPLVHAQELKTTVNPQEEIKDSQQALTARIAELEVENKNLRDRIESSEKSQIS